jgi:DNA-binding response OmpR family regulator
MKEGTVIMNILIVEDEEIVAEVLIKALKKWGQKVVWATTKHEALVKTEQSIFDMVILDIMLPDGFGYNAIPEIKQSQPGAYIITMTGDNSPQLERIVRGLGIAYFMSKPVNLKELKSIVDHYINRQTKEVA